jgi:flavin-dependent dehydrogenase
MIRRDLFEQALARKAGEAGSRINLCSKLISMDKNGVVVRAKGVTYMVKARVIIGADGPHTRVGRWIGSCNINLIPAIQVTAGLTRPMDFIEVYFYKDIFGGYGWLFPKGSRANLGIAIRKREGIRCPLKEGLDRFIARLREWGKIKGKTSGCTAGWIPAEPPRDVVHENIMLAGDAAGQTHPISGAGVAQAVTCGMMAGKWAGRAIRADDMALLGGYNEEWQDIYGEAQELAYNKRVLMEKKWDDLDDILKICWVGFREYYEERKEQVVKD